MSVCLNFQRYCINYSTTQHHEWKVEVENEQTLRILSRTASNIACILEKNDGRAVL